MRFLILAPLFAALPGTALAGPLTFAEALSRAQAEAPSLRARVLDVEARRASATSAGQLPDPRLGVGLDNYPISGPPAFSLNRDDMTMARIGISQDVPNAAKRRARTGRAQADIGVAQADALAEVRRVRVATALAWIDLAYAERRLAAIDRALADLAQYVSPAASSVASGSARPAQTLDIRQAVALLEDRRSEVAAEVARARATLSRWTGDPHPEIEGTLPAFAIDPGRLRAALEQHPDLVAAIARVRTAAAEVGVARAEKRPDWGFELAYQKRGSSYGDMVSLGATMSLPLFARKRQDPKIDAAVAGEGAALAQQEDMRRALAADLEAGLADHLMHHQQWLRAQDTLLPLARQRVDLETLSYSAGRATLLDLIQAQTSFADAALQALDREATVARDAARLVLTYGDDQ
ncbi:TolC family protein [Sphingomonas koreensis]|uniref:TolC family protein n=1 Tax=Sphingomonas koreensis TaxID=93064 RepID=UPI00234E869A|nr:TolC family protein [Sphingomonas koreensis]MDC7810184.1 TolC family protein [Sphingomonas koreensis]